jgi:hypothetical protein
MANDWRPASEPPAEGQVVLVDLGGDDVWSIRIARYWGPTEAEPDPVFEVWPKWSTDDEEDRQVLHWAPLPAPNR